MLPGTWEIVSHHNNLLLCSFLVTSKPDVAAGSPGNRQSSSPIMSYCVPSRSLSLFATNVLGSPASGNENTPAHIAMHVQRKSEFLNRYPCISCHWKRKHICACPAQTEAGPFPVLENRYPWNCCHGIRKHIRAYPA